jgi:hypothetical protein
MTVIVLWLGDQNGNNVKLSLRAFLNSPRPPIPSPTTGTEIKWWRNEFQVSQLL